MSARGSLRPVTHDEVDEYAGIWVGEAERPAGSGRRALIVDEDLSWSDAPARRGRRRRPLAEAEDWGLAGGDAWEAEPEPIPGRPRPPRIEARRERPARPMRDGRYADHPGSDYRASDHRASAHRASAHRAGDRASAEREIEQEETVESRVIPVETDPSTPVKDEIDQIPADATPIDVRVDHLELGGTGVGDGPGDRVSASGQRRTIVITGRGAEGRLPRRRSWEASLPVHERSGFKPDRVAMWAVLLGLILLLVAATSSHAAILAVHLAR